MNRTKIRKIGRDSYCIYCAEKSSRDSEGSLHNNDYVEFDVCKCKGSRKAIEIKYRIDELWEDIEDLPKIHKYKLDKMNFDLELEELRKLWNVPVDFNNPEDK
ncbi:MAG: hypothetical protein ACTSQ9_06220 [Candidatus Hodarchaeales archaeon]